MFVPIHILIKLFSSIRFELFKFRKVYLVTIFIGLAYTNTNATIEIVYLFNEKFRLMIGKLGI